MQQPMDCNGEVGSRRIDSTNVHEPLTIPTCSTTAIIADRHGRTGNVQHEIQLCKINCDDPHPMGAAPLASIGGSAVEIEICAGFFPAAASDGSVATLQGKERREQVQQVHVAMVEPDSRLGGPRIDGQRPASDVGGGAVQRQLGAAGCRPPRTWVFRIGYSLRRWSAGVRSHLGQRILVVHDGSACMRDACVHSGL